MAGSALDLSLRADAMGKLDAIFPGPGGPGSRPVRLVTRDRVYAVFAMMPLISSVSKARIVCVLTLPSEPSWSR